MNFLIIAGIIMSLFFGNGNSLYPPFEKGIKGNFRSNSAKNTKLISGITAPSDIQAKLKALDDAHKSGVLTDEEYNRKKAELEGQLRESAISEETRKKLEALESSYQAGILSKEEYEQKKADLLGQPANTPPEIKVKSSVYTDSLWGFQFPYPSNWEVKAFPGRQGVFLTHGNSNINIMLFLGSTKSSQVLDSLIEQTKAQWQNYQSIQRIDRKYNQRTMPVQEFTGTAPNGMNAHAQLTTFSSGGFVYVIFMSAPDDMFTSALPVWDDLLKGFKPIKDGKLYAHDKGFFFWYPSNWNVTKQDEFVQFVPPNAGTQGDTPTELYFMFVEDISKENFKDPNNPRIAKYLDSQIQSIVPTLKRIGEPSPVGNSVMLKWETTSPEGKIIQAYTLTRIADKNLVALVAIGLKDLLNSRDADLRKIFASMDINVSLSSATDSNSPEGQAGTVGSSTIAPGEVGDQNWGFKFRPPEGWKSQKTGEGILLGHDTIAGMIIVMPNTESDLNRLKGLMESGLSEEGIFLSLTGALQTFGNNGFVGEFEGMLNGEQVKAHGIGIVSPFGRGAYIIALTTPDKYGKEIITAGDIIAKNIQFFKVEASALMQNFAGKWTNFTPNTQTDIFLSPDGTYYDNYEASYSGNFADGGGNDLGSWGTARQDQGQGSWTVVGDRRQGKIIIKLKDGKENVLEYKVHEEKGQTYWNEYWFNGRLYSKNVKLYD